MVEAEGRPATPVCFSLPQGSTDFPQRPWDKTTGLTGTLTVHLLLTGSRPAHLKLVDTLAVHCPLIRGGREVEGGDRCFGCSHNNTNDNDDGHLSFGQTVSGTH